MPIPLLLNRIQHVAADKRLDADEWSDLEPALADTRVGAGSEADALPTLWGDSSFSTDAKTYGQLVEFLRTRGYSVPTEAKARPGRSPFLPESEAASRIEQRF